MDGSLGRGGPLQPLNNTYTITANLGKQVGPNLFQSFSQLNVYSGETALFNGPGSVHNVLARVTGGTASNIDGTLKCSIANANFYLINPSGVIFGPDAALDVSGSFAVTTANYVKLADGGKVSATVTPAGSVLTSAAPTAFGFLGKSPAGLTANGSTLAVPTGKSIVAVAGPIQLSAARVSAPGGRVGIVSTASAGTVSVDPSTLAPIAATTPNLGPVTLTNDAVVSNSGPAGGPMSITCGSLRASGGSAITSNTTGPGPGGTVTVNASGTVAVSGSDSAGNDSVISATSASAARGNAGSISITAGVLQLRDGGYLDTSTHGPGNGGNVNVGVSGQALLSGADPSSSDSGIFAGSTAGGPSGNAGSVTLTAASLQVIGGAVISAQTVGSGRGGNVAVNVSGQATLSGTDRSGNNSGIFADSVASGHSGNAGSVTLTAGSLQVLGGAAISSQTNGSGTGGDLKISVSGSAVLSGADPSSGDSGIYAISNASGASGNAGSVTLTAGSLQITSGAEISSSTFGLGRGGDLTVHVYGEVLISGVASNNSDSGIFANSRSAGAGGDAGSITLTAGGLEVSGGAQISSSTAGLGRGSNVIIDVTGQALLSGTDPKADFDSGIFANSLDGASGDAGSITLTAGSLQLTGGAQVSSQAFGRGNGGNVNVNVSGQAFFSGTDPKNSNSGIFAASNFTGHGGRAGSITLAAGSLRLTDGGGISSSTDGLGRGGDVSVNISGLALLSNDSGIITNSYAGATGGAGLVMLTAGSLQVSGGSDVSSQTFGPGNGGNVTVNVSGQASFSGTDSRNNDSGVFANSNSTGRGGDAGSIALTAASLQLTGGAAISSSTFGLARGGDVAVHVSGLASLSGTASNNGASGIAANSRLSGAGGDAGSVLLTAGSLQLLDGAQIGSSTFGLGRGGNVMVGVTGQALLAGASLKDFASGIFANSATTGDAGSIVLAAGSLQLMGGAQVSSQTYGPGNGGNVTVKVSGQALFSGADSNNGDSGVFADTNVPGRGGDAGSIALAAGSLQLTGGAAVSSSSFSSGKGGNVTVHVSGQALFSGADSLNNDSGIFATSDAIAGNAGSVTLTAGSLQVLGGAEVTSSTFGAGAGGNVNVSVSGQTLLSGADPSSHSSGIYANTHALGNAGSVAVDAGSLSISNNAEISCSTSGNGNGGNVTVSAKSLRIFGANDPGIFAQTNDTTSGGNGGIIIVAAKSLAVSGTGRISAETHGPGAAGSVNVHAGSALLSGPLATIDSRSSGSGAAGSVTVVAESQLVVNQASLEVDAGAARGGDLVLRGADLIFHGGLLLASSGTRFAGGNVRLNASDRVLLLGTRVTAAGGGNGGSISIDPLLVALDHAVFNADGGANGGNITIRPAVLLSSGSSLTASGRTGVAGSVALTPPDVSLAGSLVALPGSLALPGAHLIPQCGQMLDDADVSSFMVTGNGGAPPEPGGWVPSGPIETREATR